MIYRGDDMTDREKVIKGLEILINGCEYIHCDDCCFYISTKPLRCGLREEQIKEDALAMLKEQEAEGKWIPVTNGRGGNECSLCHSYAPSFQNGMEYLSKYCPECGAKMEKDGEVNDKDRVRDGYAERMS